MTFQTASNEIDFPANSAFTLSAWVNVASFPTSGGLRQIVGKGIDSTSEAYYLRLRESSGSVVLEVGSWGSGGDKRTIWTVSNWSTGEWHHIAGQYTGSAWVIYFDGTQVSSTTDATGPRNNDRDLNIGNRDDFGTNDRYFSGFIDELKIYNYARTQQQIVEDMNAGHPTGGSPIGSQVSHLKFDEGGGTTANDSVGTNNGTLQETATFSPNGKFGGAIQLDGTTSGTGDTHLRLPNDIFDNHTQGSISLWFNYDGTGDADQALFTVARDDDGTGADQLSLGIDSSNDHLTIAIYDGGNPTIFATSADGSITSSTWHHVVWTNDTSGNAVFLDGAPLSLSYSTGNASTDEWIDAVDEDTTAYSIGCADYDASDTDDCSNTSYMFEGYIDDFQYFSSALTADQVKIVVNANSATHFGGGTPEKTTVEGGAGNPPVGYWDFNEGTGITTNDKSGNGNNGTIDTDVSWTRGKYGKALNFPGADHTDEVTIGTLSELDITGAITVSAWVRPDTNQNTEIVGRLANSPDRGVQLTTNTGSTYTLAEFSVYSGSCDTEHSSGNSTTELTNNQWHHVLGVYEPSTAVRIYVNGVLENQNTTSIPASQCGDNNWIIGGRADNLNGNFDGLIDEVKIFDYALSPTQIAYEYNRGAPIAWYKFDECTGTTIYNSALNANNRAAGNNGTLDLGASGTTSAGTCTTSGAWFNGATGKLNASLDFDGMNDYVAITDDSSLDTSASGQHSWSFWIRPNDLADFRTVWGQSQSSDFNNPHMIIYTHTTSFDEFYTVTAGVTVTIAADVSTNYLIAHSNNNVLTTGQWQHVTITYDGTQSQVSRVRIYVNGMDQTSTTNRFSSGTLTNVTPNITQIGYDANLYDSEYFNGQIDDVRIYNYPLSPLQIRKIMLGGSATGSSVNFGPEAGSP